MDSKVRHAYQYCEWITSRHYENFPVASWLLPKPKRPFIAAIYAFARSADDFADEGKYQGRSLELLNGWRAALRAPADHPIFIALNDAVVRCRLPVQLLEDLLTAFTMDVTKKRYADWDELMTYCRYSANPVGRLVLTVFDRREPDLFRLSDSICTGLQLANHWQDLSIDLPEKDRLYVPQDLMSRYGVTVEDLKRRTISAPVRSLMEELVRRSRAVFDEGEPLLDRVRGRLRLEMKLTLLGGRAILDRIEASGYDVFRRRPVLSTGAKLKLLTHAFLS